jgi:hypothetical protein
MVNNHFAFEQIADKIREKGLKDLAILTLRTLKPLGPVLVNGLLFLEPFIGLGKLSTVTNILCEPEKLLALLEEGGDE